MKTYTLYTYVRDNGDGSPTVMYFRSKENRDNYMFEREENGDAFCDAADEVHFCILDDDTIVDVKYNDPFYLTNNLLKIHE